MIRFAFYLIILIAAVWLGLHLHADPGYILVRYGHWTIEMTLWVGILIVIIGFILVYWLLRFLNFGSHVPEKMRFWSHQRRQLHSQRCSNKGLIDLAEGHWYRAEKNLIKGVYDNDTPLVNYLAAAKAAQEQGAYDRRDNYLRQAHQVNPEAKIAIELTQAQLQIHHKQLEQALATLRHLQELAPKHSYIIKLIKTLYLELKDWESLAKILPAIRKSKIMDAYSFLELEVLIYKNLFMQSLTQNNNAIETLWQKTPRYLKSHPEVTVLYCQHLINTSQGVTAEKLIRDTLKKQWDTRLVELYSIIPEVDRKKQLLMTEYWLKAHSKDPVLLLCCGRLSEANQLWGKARSYFEASLGIKPSIEAYTELAHLCEHLNEPALALDYYRKATAAHLS